MMKRLLGGDLKGLSDRIGAGCFALYLVLSVSDTFVKDGLIVAGIEHGDVNDLYVGLSRDEVMSMLSSLRECGWIFDFSSEGGEYVCVLGKMVVIDGISRSTLPVYALDVTIREHEELQRKLSEPPSEQRTRRSSRNPLTAKRLEAGSKIIEMSNIKDAEAAEKIERRKLAKLEKLNTTKAPSTESFIKGAEAIRTDPTKNKITLLKAYSSLYKATTGVMPPRLFTNRRPNARASMILNVVRDFGLERTWEICKYVLSNWEELSVTSRHVGKLPTPDVIQRLSVELDACFQLGEDPLQRMKRAEAKPSSERAAVDEWDDDDDQEGW